MERDPQWTLIKDLFLAAAARHGEERSRYLAEHCIDSEMRREVENLPEASERTAVMELEADHTLTESAFAPPLTPGSHLGHYKIRKKLGSGGMGWVYEAHDEYLRRTVAIKVLPPGGIGEEQRRRFTREAQSASALNHP